MIALAVVALLVASANAGLLAAPAVSTYGIASTASVAEARAGGSFSYNLKETGAHSVAAPAVAYAAPAVVAAPAVAYAAPAVAAAPVAYAAHGAYAAPVAYGAHGAYGAYGAAYGAAYGGHLPYAYAHDKGPYDQAHLFDDGHYKGDPIYL